MSGEVDIPNNQGWGDMALRLMTPLAAIPPVLSIAAGY